MNNKKKGRYWAFVGYPESLPIDYLDILTKTGLAVAISPLHDKDINPTEEEKKAHYHFILCFDGPTTYNNVLDITNSLNCPIPIKLESIKGMYRYHCHIDNPEKYQYSNFERTHLNGFDISLVNELTKTQVNSIKKEIISYIRTNKILEYCDLLDILLDCELFDLFDVASNHTLFFNTYLTSSRNSYKTNSNSSR